MDEMVIVLVTTGKNESVDWAKVVTFPNKKAAEVYVRSNNTGRKKHWQKAEIIEEGESVELYQPESENEYFN